MIRLYLLVEGYSERDFVVDLLSPYLRSAGVEATAIMVTTRCDLPTGTVDKGGLARYAKPRQELLNLFAQHGGNDVRFSTMFDLYGLPADFPGARQMAGLPTGAQKALCVEQAMMTDLNEWRFIPYVQVHEFEALLLVKPAAFKAAWPGSDDKIAALADEIGPTPPEDINDRPNTAPSKRIIKHFPTYKGDKPTSSGLIAIDIGIPAMKARCPHFASWVDQLESL